MTPMPQRIEATARPHQPTARGGLATLGHRIDG